MAFPTQTYFSNFGHALGYAFSRVRKQYWTKFLSPGIVTVILIRLYITGSMRYSCRKTRSTGLLPSHCFDCSKQVYNNTNIEKRN